MILVEAVDQWLNLDLVRAFRNVSVARLELVYADGATVALEGADAENLRRWLRASSTSLSGPPEDGDFGAPEGGGLGVAPLPFEPDRREEGAG